MCKYRSPSSLAGSSSVISASHSGSNNSGKHDLGTRNTCEVPGCGRVPRKSSNSSRARFCTRHGGGRPCQYPGCQVAARGLLGFCYRHRHYANSSAYGNGVDGKVMPSPTPEATEDEVRASRLETYVPVPSCVDSAELTALTYIASTLKASQAAASTTDDDSEPCNAATTLMAIEDTTTAGSNASPLATPTSSHSISSSQSPILTSGQRALIETPTSLVTTTSRATEAAFAAHSSAACDIDELFSIPTIPFTICKPALAAACGPLGEAPCPMDIQREEAVMARCQ